MVTLFTAITMIAIAKITKGREIPDVEILILTGIIDLMILGIIVGAVVS